MEIQLLDRNLIRRYNKTFMNVDSSIARALISNGLAVEIKQMKKPPMDKMIKSPEISKFIFPLDMIEIPIEMIGQG